MPVAQTTSMTRKELYDRVWAEPVERVAQALGISDVGLAKACRRHQIPVPPRGYWRRKETGHKVRHVPLPKLSDPQRDAATVTFRPPPSPPPSTAQEEVHPLIAFERDSQNTIVVSESLQATHPLIRATRKYWAAVKRGEVKYGENKLPHLNIRVSPAAQARAFRLMHALLTALDQRQFTTSATADGKSIVVVLGVTLELSLRERLKQVAHEPTAKERENMQRYSWATPPKFDSVHTGEFELTLERTWGTRHLWRDGKRQRLEQLLNDVVEGLVEAALKEQAREAEAEKRRQAEAEAQRRREEVQRLEREERARIRHLEQLMAASERHEQLQEFVERLRKIAREPDPDSELGHWFDWASGYLQESDPLRVWRNPQPLITLYHPAYRYELQDILEKGFRDRLPEHGEDQELPPSVLLGDVPLTRGYDSICLTVAIPESVVLPYESTTGDRPYRRFNVPAAIVKRYGEVSTGS